MAVSYTHLGREGAQGLMLYTGRRNLIKRDIVIRPGEVFSCRFYVRVCEYIPVVGEGAKEDNSVYVTVLGAGKSSARISGLKIAVSYTHLSGGQRQRVAMGRAIVRNPKVFLMDEPLSNLDAKLRVQMRIEIAKLHQRLGTTIILSVSYTHLGGRQVPGLRQRSKARPGRGLFLQNEQICGQAD